MRGLKIAAVLLGLAALTRPAFALDLRDAYVWSLSEGSPSKLGLLTRNPALRTGHYEHAMLNCDSSGAQLSLGPPDHKVLGQRIAGGGLPEVKLTIDGKDFNFPYDITLFYDLHDEEWVYQFSVDSAFLKALGDAKNVTAQGTGLDLILPAPEKNDFAAFIEACAQSGR